MFRQTISRRSRPTDKHTTETVHAKRNGRRVAARREAPRSGAPFQPRPTAPRATPLPAPSLAGRPHGHVVGHGLGQRTTPSFAGRPHGHVVGHRVGTAPPLPTGATYRNAA